MTVAAAVGGAALGVGGAVAATSHTLVSAPQSATAPEVAAADLAPLPAQVKGYTILRPSSLVMDTPSGLRILFGTGLAVTGLPEPDSSALGQLRALDARSTTRSPLRHSGAVTSASFPSTPAPTSPADDAEADFPGRGEERRSEKADPRRSERAEEQAATLSAKGADRQDQGRNTGRSG